MSVLDLSPVPEGRDTGRALRNFIDLARHPDHWDTIDFGWRNIATCRDCWRGDRRGSGPCGDGHQAHSHWCRRHHVAESRPSADRRTVRHISGAASGKGRSRSWPDAGVRPNCRPGHAAEPDRRCGAVRCRCGRTNELFPTGRSWSSVAGGACGRGRDASHAARAAQIRACAANALGSCLGCLTSKR